MKKTYRIQKFGAFGEGIAYDDGKTVFVKGAIKDETVIAKTLLKHCSKGLYLPDLKPIFIQKMSMVYSLQLQSKTDLK